MRYSCPTKSFTLQQSVFSSPKAPPFCYDRHAVIRPVEEHLKRYTGFYLAQKCHPLAPNLPKTCTAISPPVTKSPLVCDLFKTEKQGRPKRARHTRTGQSRRPNP